MPRKGRDGKKLSRFIALPWEVVDSPAWRELTNAARVAYIHMKRKVVNSHPGEITLSFKEMEPIMQRRTFADALTLLEEKGFIKKTQRGGLRRHRNYFSFVNDWRAHG
jgi:hypothetical protein